MEKKSYCPVKITARAIGGKWKIVILYHLKTGTKRFAELRREIGDITERMLAQQLKELEADGLVNRKVYPEVPPRVEYSLTSYCKTLLPILDMMAEWGLKHQGPSRKKLTSKSKKEMQEILI